MFIKISESEEISDRGKEKFEPKIEWKNKTSAVGRFESGKNSYKVDGPLKIERWSDATSLDGVEFSVKWYALDKTGKRATEKPTSIDQGGGHVGGTGILSGIFGIAPPSNVFFPPEKNLHGWEAEVEIPGLRAYNDNNNGVYLMAYPSKSDRFHQ